MEMVNEVPMFVWAILGCFFAFIGYRVYRSKTRDRSSGGSGVHSGGSSNTKEK